MTSRVSNPARVKVFAEPQVGVIFVHDRILDAPHRHIQFYLEKKEMYEGRILEVFFRFLEGGLLLD